MKINTNDILYRIKKSLNLSMSDMQKAYELEDYKITKDRLEDILKKRQDKGFIIASYEELGVFLDGLISLKRGKTDRKSDENVELTNNLILKKLRVALQLKEAESEIIFGLADIELTKQQLASLFRKDGHKNFKICSDELLISFLDGLDEFYFVGVVED